MKNIHQSEPWVIRWYSEAKCIHFIFKVYTQNMTKEEYKEELQVFIELVKKYKPKSIYADTRDFLFTIAPEVQDFINNNILALYSEVGVEKHAILVSRDIFAEVSVEQTMDEAERPSYENVYFDHEEVAKEWLGIK